MVHEWALAEAIAEYIDKLSREENSKVIEEIEIRLGLLQSIDRDVLDFALKEILKTRGFIIHNIVYHNIELILQCRKCGFKWSINMEEVDEAIREAIHFVPETVYSFFKCPKCGSRDFEIISGRGVEIGKIIWRK